MPKSKLLEAFNCGINHRGGLTVYLEHGIVPISNVIIEQQIRSLKLGAKNWLFAASEEGAEAVAIFNSLVCTCKINGINVFEYLNDVLGALGSKSAAQLTPIAWGGGRSRGGGNSKNNRLLLYQGRKSPANRLLSLGLVIKQSPWSSLCF